jgi:ribosome-associated protein
VLMDIHEISSFADYFIICSGTSDRMLNALAEGAVEQVKKAHNLKPRVEGSPDYGWLLADFGDVIVHLFSPEKRSYYRIEELWSEGKILLHVQ